MSQSRKARQSAGGLRKAVYQIAQLRFGQKKYAEATEAGSYINKYPTARSVGRQRGIINASYQIAMDAVQPWIIRKPGLFETLPEPLTTAPARSSTCSGRSPTTKPANWIANAMMTI